ncbi:MAG: hypothetical protein M3Q30_23960 [Actinomycetota bacterium]|nr:hypothetical protein [Actinomycetota bacterium]
MTERVLFPHPKVRRRAIAHKMLVLDTTTRTALGTHYPAGSPDEPEPEPAPKRRTRTRKTREVEDMGNQPNGPATPNTPADPGNPTPDGEGTGA